MNYMFECFIQYLWEPIKKFFMETLFPNIKKWFMDTIWPQIKTLIIQKIQKLQQKLKNWVIS